MITDLVQIRLLGEKKRDENLRFRRFMKSRDHSDRILRCIAEGIEDQIDCMQCANYCRVATAKVAERDIERMARYLRISPRGSWRITGLSSNWTENRVKNTLAALDTGQLSDQFTGLNAIPVPGTGWSSI